MQRFAEALLLIDCRWQGRAARRASAPERNRRLRNCSAWTRAPVLSAMVPSSASPRGSFGIGEDAGSLAPRPRRIGPPSGRARPARDADRLSRQTATDHRLKRFRRSRAPVAVPGPQSRPAGGACRAMSPEVAMSIPVRFSRAVPLWLGSAPTVTRSRQLAGMGEMPQASSSSAKKFSASGAFELARLRTQILIADRIDRAGAQPGNHVELVHIRELRLLVAHSEDHQGEQVVDAEPATLDKIDISVGTRPTGRNGPARGPSHRDPGTAGSFGRPPARSPMHRRRTDGRSSSGSVAGRRPRDAAEGCGHWMNWARYCCSIGTNMRRMFWSRWLPLLGMLLRNKGERSGDGANRAVSASSVSGLRLIVAMALG